MNSTNPQVQIAILFLKQAIASAMKEGGNKFLEELVEALEIPHIDYMIKVLQKVKGRKENVISTGR